MQAVSADSSRETLNCEEEKEDSVDTGGGQELEGAWPISANGQVPGGGVRAKGVRSPRTWAGRRRGSLSAVWLRERGEGRNGLELALYGWEAVGQGQGQAGAKGTPRGWLRASWTFGRD